MKNISKLFTDKMIICINNLHTATHTYAHTHRKLPPFVNKHKETFIYTSESYIYTTQYNKPQNPFFTFQQTCILRDTRN